jgi:hypothetical protein
MVPMLGSKRRRPQRSAVERSRSTAAHRGALALRGAATARASERSRASAWAEWRPAVLRGICAGAAFEAGLLLSSLVFRFGPSFATVAAGKRLGVLDIWGRWDWAWYQAIAQGGYIANHARQSLGGVFQDGTAFAPGYPLSVRAASDVLHIPLIDAGMLITFICTVVALIGLYKLAQMDWGPGVARTALLLTLIFPGALFLVAPYTEAPLLMCSVWAFLMVRRERLVAAGLFAAAATAVKMPWLLFLVPALCVEWLDGNGWRPRWGHLRLLLIVLPAAAVLIEWMLWQLRTFGDAFDFLHAQAGWTPAFTPVWTVIADSFTASLRDAAGGAGLEVWVFRGLELAAMAFSLVMAVYVLLRVRRSYGVFLLTGFLVISNSGGNFVSSEIRFLAPFFAIFLGLALLVHRRPRLLPYVGALWVPLLLLFTARFVNGLWAG